MPTCTRRTVIGSLMLGSASTRFTTDAIAAPASPVATPLASPATGSTPPTFATGITLYVKRSDAEDHAAARHLLADRARAGDSAICLVIPFTQDRIDGNQPRTDADLTPALADVRFVVREARRHDMAVMIKPLMDERHLMESGPAGAWRGTLQPSDPNAWFANYAALIEPWVRLAVDEGCTWFVIGSEFSSLEAREHESSWRALIASTRDAIGSGSLRLTYGQNWDTVAQPPAWLADLDLLSIDAYYPLHGVDDGSPVDALVDAFQEHTPTIQGLRGKFPGKPLYFTEVGISSTTGVYSAPWSWGDANRGAVNLDAQRVFFAAACRFYGSVGDGIFWWVAYVHPLDDPHNDPGFQFIGKPAEAVVNRCSASHRE